MNHGDHSTSDNHSCIEDLDLHDIDTDTESATEDESDARVLQDLRDSDEDEEEEPLADDNCPTAPSNILYIPQQDGSMEIMIADPNGLQHHGQTVFW